MKKHDQPKKTVYEEEKGYLLHIKEILSSTGLPCELKESAEGMALFMPLAPEGPISAIPLMVQLQKQPVGNVDVENAQEIPTVLSILFVAHLPVKAKPETLINTVLLMNYINSNYPISGFEVEMGAMQPLFKYTLVNTPSNVEKTVLLCIIGIIMYAMDIFYGQIKNVAEGKTTFQQALQQIAATAPKQN